VTDASEVFVDYRVRWKTSGLRPGAFLGLHAGAGDRIRASVPLHENADPRRIDVRATLRDPLGGIWVRELEQNSALKVVVLADVSASMGYIGRHDKLDQLRRIAVSLARSAFRNGDAFGFYAASDVPHDALAMPVRVDRGAGEWIARKLAAFTPSGDNARGLVQVIARLPHRRALVFLVSDFHWPKRDIEAIMRRLAHHAVVPVVLRDPAEADAIHHRGIAVLRDLETGAQRFVWLRRGLIDALRRNRDRRDDTLRRICRATGCSPFFVRDRFDPALLSRYFAETAS
jgi:uncharacterized protein (DUF58 family)